MINITYSSPENNTYVIDNFFQNYLDIISFIKRNDQILNYTGHQQVAFFGGGDNAPEEECPEEWYHLLSKIEKIINQLYEKNYKPLVNNFNAVVYKDGSFKECHTDSEIEDSEESRCDLTSIFMLNKDFNGGLLRIDDLNLDIPTEPSRLVVFPSSLRHSVTTVTGGIRYVNSIFWKGD